MRKKLKFVETCSACPEQYDVFLGDKQVGYLRLRSGWFRVDFPECGGETIYEHYFDDGWKGCFDDTERDYFLKEAEKAIIKKIKSIEK